MVLRHINKSTIKSMTTEAFIEETKTMRPMLLSVARDILGSDDEAEDVVQDAMLRLWQLRDEPIRNPRGFARIVVRNLSLSKVRRKRVTVDISQADMASDDEAEARNEQTDRLMALIDTLPTMQQTVLRLRHMQDMAMADIASLIGTSEVAVRQSLSRARRNIVEQFKTIEK
jgi:RNA polymerase sigma-70 factor (ECF subfamily)